MLSNVLVKLHAATGPIRLLLGLALVAAGTAVMSATRRRRLTTGS